MNNYGYFPTYTTMLPLYQTVLGNYGIGGTGTQDSSSKSSRNKWYDNQNRFSNQQSSDKEKANKGTTLGKEFTGGDGRDGFGGGTTSSSKGNDAGPSNKGHSFTDKQAMDAAMSGFGQMGLDAATKTGLALGLNAPVNAALNFGLSGIPGSLAGTVGQIGAASLGMTTGTTMGSMAFGALGGLLGGPIGGMIGGLVGPTIGGLLADAFDARAEEPTRDVMEDTFGQITGRQIGAAYANNIATHNMDMATINDMSLAQAINDAIAGSKSLSPNAVANATAAVNNSIGMANPTSSWGRDMVGPVAAAYAGAMSSLGGLGMDTGSFGGDSKGGFASTGSFGGIGTDQGGFGTGVGGAIGGGAMSHGATQGNFGGIGGFGSANDSGLSGIGGVSSSTAADTAASTSAAESDTAGGTATGDTSEGTDSGTTGEGGANEGNDAGNDSGDNGSTGNDGDSGGSGGDGNGGGFGNDGGGGSGGDGDNNGGPNGGSDSQGTGEGQAGDGTGSGANGQNDGGDDGGW